MCLKSGKKRFALHAVTHDIFRSCQVSTRMGSDKIVNRLHWCVTVPSNTEVNDQFLVDRSVKHETDLIIWQQFSPIDTLNFSVAY